MEETKDTTFETVKPYMLCAFVSLTMAAFSIISKVCLDGGISRYVLVAYGFAFGALATTVLSLLFERKNESKLSRVIWIDIFFLGILRALGIITFFAGLQYTTAAFSGAMVNLVPSMTFTLAILFRMEKLSIAKMSGRAKIGGTIVAFGGATLMTLYKGITVVSFHSHHHHKNPNLKVLPEKNYLKGSLFLVVHCLSTAAFVILQTRTIKIYPAPMKLTTLMGLSATVIATIVAAITDHKALSWKLSWDLALVAPLYNGIVVFGITAYVQTLIVKKSGPVFLTSYRPVTTVIIAIMGVLILGEALFLGEIMGAILIMLGLYAILWGKAVDKRKNFVEPIVFRTSSVVDPEKAEGKELDPEKAEGKELEIQLRLN